MSWDTASAACLSLNAILHHVNYKTLYLKMKTKQAVNGILKPNEIYTNQLPKQTFKLLHYVKPLKTSKTINMRRNVPTRNTMKIRRNVSTETRKKFYILKSNKLRKTYPSNETTIRKAVCCNQERTYGELGVGESKTASDNEILCMATLLQQLSQPGKTSLTLLQRIFRTIARTNRYNKRCEDLTWRLDQLKCTKQITLNRTNASNPNCWNRTIRNEGVEQNRSLNNRNGSISTDKQTSQCLSVTRTQKRNFRIQIPSNRVDIPKADAFCAGSSREGPGWGVCQVRTP